MNLHPAKRLARKVTVDANGCHIFTGAIDPTGYGRFFLNGKQDYAHRAAVKFARGPIPDGMDVDHLCRVRACCNADHLEVVTRRTNLLRGETLTAAHKAGRNCGFDACPSCKRFRVEATA